MDVWSHLLPPGVPLQVAAALCLVSSVTSLVTATFGVGGGVALLAVMGLLLPVGAVIPVHGMVQLGSNVGRAWLQRAHVPWRPLGYFVVGSLFGSLVGAQFVVTLAEGALQMLLGTFVLVVVWARLPSLVGLRPGSLAFIGVGTSFLGMFVGATGPLMVALFEKALPDRRAVVATHAAAMSAQHALKVVAFGLTGFAFPRWVPLLSAMIVTGHLGTFIGSRLLDGMPEGNFRKAFRVVVSLLAIASIARGCHAIARW